MNIFQFVPLMKSLNSTISTISVTVVAVFLVFIILRLFSGMKLGFMRQLIRAAFSIAAAVVSFIVANSLSKSIIGSVKLDNVADLLPMIDGIGLDSAEVNKIVDEMVSGFPTEMVEYILLLPATIIIVPMIFAAIFFAIKTIGNIASSIICTVFGIKKAETNPQRLGGLVFAGVEGIIFFLALLVPVTGALGIVDQTYQDALTSEDSVVSAELITDYKENIIPFTQNPVVSFLREVGGDAIYSELATVEIDGEKSHIDKEIVPIVRFFLVDAKADENGEKVDWGNLTEENKAAITRLVNCVGDSRYLSRLFVSLVRACSGLVQDVLDNTLEDLGNLDSGNSDDLGIDYDDGLGDGIGDIIGDGDKNESIEPDPIVTSLIDFLKTFEVETLKQDLITLRDMYFLMSDCGIFRAMDESDDSFTDILAGNGASEASLISDFKDILQKNPRTAPILKALTNLLLDGILTGGSGEVTYDDLKADMNTVLEINKENYSDEDDYKKALSNTINSVLNSNGVKLDKEAVNQIADYVDKNYSEIDSLTDEMFNDILLKYYDVYLEYTEGK